MPVILECNMCGCQASGDFLLFSGAFGRVHFNRGMDQGLTEHSETALVCSACYMKLAKMLHLRGGIDEVVGTDPGRAACVVGP